MDRYVDPYSVLKDENMVPTIGILMGIGDLNTSGKIFTFTDSDCIDSNTFSFAITPSNYE
jgi:hypothetical protein